MALLPSRTKYRKSQRGNMQGLEQNCNTLDFGEYGLQALDRGWVKNIQIEAARVAITRHLKRRGKVWIRMFPDKPISKKPLEVRMGKGKGNVDAWVAVVRPGRMLFELSGCTESLAREALCLAAAKICIKTKFVTRHAATRG